MIEKQIKLYVYRGATTTLEFDFTEFDFERSSKCIFTMTNLCENKIIKQFEFTEATKYICVIDTAFSLTLQDNFYKYNIVYQNNIGKYPVCLNSDIEIIEVING